MAAALVEGDEETKKKLLDSKEKMFEGESFSKVIKETQIYSPLHARMIMIAERTGEADQALSKIAVQVDEEVTAEIQNFVSVIEPTIHSCGCLTFIGNDAAYGNSFCDWIMKCQNIRWRM